MNLKWNLDSSTSIALDVMGEDGLPTQTIITWHVPREEQRETIISHIDRINALHAELQELIPPTSCQPPTNTQELGRLLHYLSLSLL